VKIFSFVLAVVEEMKSSAGKNPKDTCKKDIVHLSTTHLDAEDK